MRYRREIDGLRAIAVLPVILFHAGAEFFSGGYVGVDVFFVISGYLITTIILSERDAGQFSLANFYERRARRILPALFAMVLVCLPLAWLWMMPYDLVEFFDSVVAVSFFYSNVFFWLQSGYFDTAAEMKPLLHTWSLAVEEQYYLLFPLFMMLMWRFGKRSLFASLTLIGAASLALAQWGAIDHPKATFFLLHTRLWELLLGSLTAFYLLYWRRDRHDRSSTPPLSYQGLAATGLLLILYATVAFDRHTPFPGFPALLPTVGTALIIIYGTGNTLIGRLLSTPALVGIGLVSYSAYLWHQPLFAFARLNSLGEPGGWLMAALGALALVIAYFSWRFVEQPFRNKAQFSRQIVFRGAVVLTLALGLTGFTGQLRDGEVQRYTAAQQQRLAEIERLKEERRVLMRADECHFTEQHELDVEAFLDNWDCWSDADDVEMQKIPIVVVGDSHAADIAVALRANGYAPLQLGGSGCSLDPEFMTHTCRQIFDNLLADYQAHPDFQYILLANRFSKNELSLQSIGRTIDYWEKFGLNIAILTAMPRFPNFEKAVMLSRQPGPDFAIADLSERDELVDYLVDRGVHVIKRRHIFCSLSASCGFRDANQQLLLVDSDHFSHEGARRFGERLLSDDKLFSSIR